MTEMEQPLRILWLVPDFPKSDHDPSHVFLLSEALSLAGADGVQLRVVSGDGGDHCISGLAVGSIYPPSTVLAKLGMMRWSLLRDPSLLYRAIRWRAAWYPVLWRQGAIDREIRSFRPDVVHSHFAFPDGTAGVAAAKRHGARAVVSLRGVDLLVNESTGHGYRRDLEYDGRLRKSVSRADRVLVASELMRNVALEIGTPADHLTVLANAVSAPNPKDLTGVTAPRASLGISAEATVMLSVGHLLRLKGFDIGIAALSRLVESLDCHYVIVGEGEQHEPLVAQAAALGIGDRVHLVGEVPHGEVWRWMHDADMYWFLSRTEAFGNVVLEAYAAGLPIVASTIGVAPTLLADDPAAVVIGDTEPAAVEAAAYALHTATMPRAELLAARASTINSHTPIARRDVLIGIYRGG